MILVTKTSDQTRQCVRACVYLCVCICVCLCLCVWTEDGSDTTKTGITGGWLDPKYTLPCPWVNNNMFRSLAWVASKGGKLQGVRYAPSSHLALDDTIRYLGYVFASVLLKLFLEDIHSRHHFPRIVPAETLFLQLYHDQQGRRNELHPGRRLIRFISDTLWPHASGRQRSDRGKVRGFCFYCALSHGGSYIFQSIQEWSKRPKVSRQHM